MNNFVTPYNYVRGPGEINNGPRLVELKTYIDNNKLIEQMIISGRRLASSRQGYDFDAGEEIPDDYNDPTRDSAYDLADASRDMRGLENKFNDELKNQKSKKEAAKLSADVSASGGRSEAAIIAAPKGD